MIRKNKQVYLVEAESPSELHTKLHEFYRDCGGSRCTLVSINSNMLGWYGFIEVEYEESILP